MKSRISSCKAAALKKDIGRFWPVWAGYLLCLVILQVVLCAADNTLNYWYASNLTQSMGAMGMVNFVFALAAAQALFGDLFNARMCNGLHSLPLKREHWFSVHLTAGLLFSLIPTALMAVFGELILRQDTFVTAAWQLPLYWWAAVNLQYLFFFGMAVFSVMCTGNRFAMLVVYGVLNGFSILLWMLVDGLYTPLLFGVVTQSRLFEVLCPLYHILSGSFVTMTRTNPGAFYLDGQGIEQVDMTSALSLVPQSWVYLLIVAAVGIVLIVAARAIYKKRQLECAGDFMAVRWLNPVFQVVFTVLCAAGFYGMIVLFLGGNDNIRYPMLGLGLLIGWFGGRILLERTTRVFRGRNILGFALMAAVMAGSLYLVSLDPLGIADFVPRAEQVERITVTLSWGGSVIEAREPEDIQAMEKLHEAALSEHIVVHPDYSEWDDNADAAYIRVHYVMKNGWTVGRNYYVSAQGSAGEILRDYANRVENLWHLEGVKDAADFRYKMGDVTSIIMDQFDVPEDMVDRSFTRRLANAILADCEAGTMVQNPVFHPSSFDGTGEGLRWFWLNCNGENFRFSIDIFADCENTLAVLEETGVLDQIRQKYINIES